jgi:hypothetical protein
MHSQMYQRDYETPGPDMMSEAVPLITLYLVQRPEQRIRARNTQQPPNSDQRLRHLTLYLGP